MIAGVDVLSIQAEIGRTIRERKKLRRTMKFSRRRTALVMAQTGGMHDD
jgi:hypothetical protein